MAVTSTSLRFSSGLLSSLRRITSGSQYLPEIDGLRFIAITSVLLYHVGRLTEIHIHPYVVPAGRLAASLTAFVFNGYRGVPVFFAISGFIVALPFARRELQGAADTPLATYFRRRLTRIAPPYVISQLIRLYPVMIAKQLTLLQILPHLAAGLLYLHLALYRTAPIVQIVGWSLEIEVQFYIVAPFLVRFIFRIPAPWRRMLLVGAIAVDGILMHLASTVLPADPNSTSVLGTLVNFTLVY